MHDERASERMRYGVLVPVLQERHLPVADWRRDVCRSRCGRILARASKIALWIRRARPARLAGIPPQLACGSISRLSGH